MLFHSLDYALFLVLALVVYWALWRAGVARLVFIAVASLAFYMAWRPTYVGLILTPTIVDWLAGRQMGRTSRPGVRKAWLALSVTSNLCLLGAFKYFNWMSGSVTDALGLFGIHASPPVLHVLLPAGISFYTFEAIS